MRLLTHAQTSEKSTSSLTAMSVRKSGVSCAPPRKTTATHYEEDVSNLTHPLFIAKIYANDFNISVSMGRSAE